MKIKFKVECEVEVVETYDGILDEVDSSMEVFKTGDIFDHVDVIDRHEDHNTVDIQFGDGSVAFGLNSNWFEEIRVKDNYPNGECPDCCEPIPDEAEDGCGCENCGHVFYTATEDELAAEELRRDEKRGTYPGREDIAN